ncbi:MAG TPA: hypothetical protein VF766_01340, partial [Pyrinomonadaceae bacterium]
MTEHPNQASAQDVLQSSALTARLLRRLTVAQGIIDVVKLRQAHARLAAWGIRATSLLDDLRTRYGLDDDDSRMESPPLVMEQPWMVNINSYLTNYNSFSATTNQFISSAATSQALQPTTFSSQGTQSSAPLTIYSSTQAPKLAADSTRLPTERFLADSSSSSSSSDSPSSSSGKFRISRNPSRRAWKANPADAQGVSQAFVFKEASASTPSTPAASDALTATPPEARKVNPADEATAADDKTAITSDERKAIISDERTQPNLPQLPLARTQIAQPQAQSERREDEALSVSSPVAKLSEVARKRASVEDEQPILHARSARRPGVADATEETKKSGSSTQPAPPEAGVPPLTTKADITAEADASTPAARAAVSTEALKTPVPSPTSNVPPPISQADASPPIAQTTLPLLHARVLSKPGAENPMEEREKVGGSVQPSPARNGAETPTAKALVTTSSEASVTPTARAAAAETPIVTPSSQADVPPPMNLTALPLVQKQTASSQTQARPPDFIWRKSADIPAMKELTTLISQGGTQAALNRITGGASDVRSQERGQMVAPEDVSRRDDFRAGSELTTERVLRSINRKLLI